jgi:hypothetical protein
VNGGKCGRVILVLVCRDEDSPVDDEEIGIGCRKALTIFVMAGRGPGQGDQTVRTTVAGPEGFQFLGHLTKSGEMKILFIGTGYIGDRILWAESCQRVDMGVGVVPGQKSAAEPEEVLRAKCFS